MRRMDRFQSSPIAARLDPTGSSRGLMITLHGTKLSGHSHRVELMLHLLGLSYRYEGADASVRIGAAFQTLNPLGQVPVLVDDGVVLADSAANLVYLARKYDSAGQWMPSGPAAEAAVQRWLSLSAGLLFSGPATARMVALFGMDGDLVRAHAAARRLLGFMEGHLANAVGQPRAFLAAPHPTVADVALYSYVAHAPEGGVSLEAYSAVQAWLRRVEALPGFVPMARSPVPA